MLGEWGWGLKPGGPKAGKTLTMGMAPNTLTTAPAPAALPPHPTPPMCSTGGVVVTSANGKIVCSNTLDDRLRITYAQLLSVIRSVLFG